MAMIPHSDRTYRIEAGLFAGILAVNILGLFNPIFTQDSALYASIAKRFLMSGDAMNIYVDGADWLDKPHFPFWIAALSMYALGASGFAYKLASLLFFLLALFYTYLLAKDAYGREVGRWAVLLCATALHITISNNDVRAEGYLLGTSMGATYHFYRLGIRYRHKDLLMGALYAAAGVMTKGIFTLAIPCTAVLAEAVMKKKYRSLWAWRWVAAALLTGLFITPELYALYRQFDMHPEKTVWGRTGVSGIHFFFVGSQFDRFRNVGPITQTSAGSVFFFLHTLLWAFAPWAILLYAALAQSIRNVYRRATEKEYVSLAVSVVMLSLFSLSRFQLPHYTNIVMPFFAILVARFLLRDRSDKKAALMKYSFVIHGLIVAVVCGLLLFFFDRQTVYFSLLLIPFAGGYWLISRAVAPRLSKFFYLSCWVAVGIGAYLNVLFYPKLLSYQGEVKAAQYANAHLPERPVMLRTYARLFEFYISNYSLARYAAWDLTPEAVSPGTLFFISEDEKAFFEQANIPYRVVKRFDDFPVTSLTWRFLYAKTRPEVLKKVYLIEFLPPKEG